MPEVGAVMCVAQKKQAEGLSPMCWQLHKMYVGWGVGNPACAMENWDLAQKEALGGHTGNVGVGE